MSTKKMIINRMKCAFVIIFTAILATLLFAGCKKGSNNVKNKNNALNEAADDNGSNEEDNKQETAADNEDNIEEDTNNKSAADNVEVKEKLNINVAALKGPTGIGMVKLMEDSENNNTLHNYNFTIAGEADEISAGLIKGDFDIAAVPCNLASVLYNKTKGQIKLAAINTLGVLYIVETGTSIETVEDLKGKTIYSTGYGTTPQYTLNYLLNSYGIDPEKDVTVEYKTEATEVAAILSETDNAIAMLPQPYVTTVMMNNDKVRIAINIDEEWKALNDGDGVVTGVLAVNKNFLENNPEAVNDFLKEYQVSTDFVNKNVDAASQLVEKFGLFKAAVAKKAIPYCNITFVNGSDMKEMAERYLNILFGQNPNSVGGALPSEDFYYIP
ncbi:MAG TPA: ABC transporter substrate-binding protein [Mobilitalea sp.]|nr:ABC transporter substrate-binding protein [Mobilitalea sp.]